MPYDEVKRNNILSLNISIRRKHLLCLMMRKRETIFYVFKYKYQKETSAVPYDEVKRNNILCL